MTSIIIVVIALIVAIPLLIAATRPTTFRVARTIDIDASPQHIHPLINDFGRWGQWSPYEKKDPAMRREFGAVTVGDGATYAWEGNNDVGQGSMRILESSPSRIRIQLEFLKPFQASNVAEFTFDHEGPVTHVGWAMSGPAPFINRLICLFFNMDKMVGTDFEKGLATLKSIVEGTGEVAGNTIAGPAAKCPIHSQGASHAT
ncbi:SRPBCC family protein [Lysobacter fragariae]